MLFVGYSMSIIKLKKIVQPMYHVRPIIDVDYYSRENCRANVLCLSDIGCRLSSQRIMFIRYLMSIITLEKIVEPMY